MQAAVGREGLPGECILNCRDWRWDAVIRLRAIWGAVRGGCIPHLSSNNHLCRAWCNTGAAQHGLDKRGGNFGIVVT